MARQAAEKKTTTQKLARKARKEAEKALHAQDHEPAERVHDLRVSIKLLRSLGRLARYAGLPGEAGLDRRLQSIARALSPARDSTVTNDWLKGHAFPQAAPAAHPKLPQLEKRLRAAEKDFLATLERFPLDAKRLAAALGESASRVRKTWKKARKSRNDEDFHSWRKRAKNLQYQLGLLGKDSPPLVKLGKRLGRIHDRVIVETFLGRNARSAWAAQAKKEADKEKRRLQKKVLAEAKKALPRKPRQWAQEQLR